MGPTREVVIFTERESQIVYLTCLKHGYVVLWESGEYQFTCYAEVCFYAKQLAITILDAYPKLKQMKDGFNVNYYYIYKKLTKITHRDVFNTELHGLKGEAYPIPGTTNLKYQWYLITPIFENGEPSKTLSQKCPYPIFEIIQPMNFMN